MRNVIRIARVGWGYERNLNTEFITVDLVPQEREMGTSRKEPWVELGCAIFPMNLSVSLGTRLMKLSWNLYHL